jgi:hypothetical protein
VAAALRSADTIEIYWKYWKWDAGRSKWAESNGVVTQGCQMVYFQTKNPN